MTVRWIKMCKKAKMRGQLKINEPLNNVHNIMITFKTSKSGDK